MIAVYKLLSVLLEYPDKALVDNWDEVKQLLADPKIIVPEDKKVLTEFVNWASELSLTRYQASYVDTFDLNSKHSLYLTFHLFDEQDRDRGPALIELSELYKKTGFEIADGELPDYLPLVLEYVSTMEDEESARQFLQQTTQAIDIIATNLEEAKSPYAPLLRLIERHGHLATIAA
jgi:nitrate reductase delta subunit